MSFKLPPRKKRSLLPGFGLTLGITVMYLGALILIPLSTIFIKIAGLGWGEFWNIVTAPELLAAYKLSFGAALIAAAINAVFGLIVAWVLVRYEFPGKQLVDGLVDLPFALPTAVAGITLTTLYAKNGWIGQWLNLLGIKAAFTPLGVVIALTFVGLPFVIRIVQPVLESLGQEAEEAAATLGASRWSAFVHVILPEIAPALLTGFVLAFSRGLGEYGSVVFISGNMPMKTEIVPFIIVTRLEQYDYIGANAIAAVMLVVSFVLLLVVNILLMWSSRYSGRRQEVKA